MILMFCHSLSAAKISIRILYMSSGESLWLQDCVPSEEFSYSMVIWKSGGCLPTSHTTLHMYLWADTGRFKRYEQLCPIHRKLGCINARCAVTRLRRVFYI
ncbi:hypothetical protein AMECASPLE_005940 [Ameca splendens]|uniref:Secreted protein n=1 Tax=Ameca splendens TaxID=208324 RepID=A0ABV0YAF2_9TELE